MSDRGASAAEVLDYLRGREPAMVELLTSLASAESPSNVPASQEPVQALLGGALERVGCAVRRIRGRASGGHLYARPRMRRRGRPIQLLLGHSDTVWPTGTLEEMPVRSENGIVRGPGTFDMKAGLVQAVFALECMGRLNLDPPATPVVFVNSDEEIGSPESKRWVERLARRAARAFVLEPAMGPDGRLKTARKGMGSFTVTVRGRAAHAGLDPTAGVSAILELARVVERLHGLTDLGRGTTVNVGVVRGGTRPNVVAAEARAEVDVRATTLEEARAVEDAIRRIQPSSAGASIEVEGGMRVPPMERTPRNVRLWEAARAAAERLGLHLDQALSGGGSDGNTTSLYTATLDGLGPVGDGAHARHEHVLVRALAERTALVVELLMAPVDP
jgi:glutamate carboxypeptidase